MKTILIADDHSFIGEAIELFIGEDQYIVIEDPAGAVCALYQKG